MAALLVLCGCPAILSAQDVQVAQVAATESRDVEILTRGPVHEAFASLVSFDPLPGILVTKLPPDVIEEVPPEYKPEGDNIAWIPGYWGWDEERTDYIWISGIWRALPPDREWIAGYWSEASGQYQWTSGYWNNIVRKQTTYLPPPPASLEVGPNIAAPSADYGWLPGSWLWHEDRYAWQPGYWDQQRADWLWVPAHYVWSPRGHIYVEGYWDRPVSRRGVLFAPVYYSHNVYAQPDYRYSPSVAINLSVFAMDIFLRPRYNQYYFGDYYSSNYRSDGYYAPYGNQRDFRSYDAINDYQRWEHRNDNNWEKSVRNNYQNRYDNVSARPPRSWSAMQKFANGDDGSRNRDARLAQSYDEYVKSSDSKRRYRKIGNDDRKDITRHNQDVRDFSKQRREMESKRDANESRKGNVLQRPIKVDAPRSPIISRSGPTNNGDAPPPKSKHATRPGMTNNPSKPESTKRPDKESAKPRVEAQREPTKPRVETQREPAKQKEQPRRVEPTKRPDKESATPDEEARRKAKAEEKARKSKE